MYITVDTFDSCNCICLKLLKVKVPESTRRPKLTCDVRHEKLHGLVYTVGEHKTFSLSRKILSIVIIWYWLQCY